MRILIVTQAYPPINVGGTMRPLRWSNYLASMGHEVSVLCLDPEQEQLHLDHGLKRQIGGQINVRTVHRKKSRWRNAIDSRYFFTTDSFWHEWKKDFKRQLMRLISEWGPPDTVIISCPPFSLVKAQNIIRRHTNAKVILDLRDAWSLWVTSPYPSYLHYLLTRRREHNAIIMADAVCVSSPTTRSDLISTHGDWTGRKIHVIENTFDQYSSSGSDSADRSEKCSRNTLITISYIGSFYYSPYSQSLIEDKWYQKKPYQYFQYVPRKENWKYRSPYFIFKVFEQLYKQYPEYRGRVKIRFVGDKPPWWSQMLSEFDLANSVDHVGVMSKEDTIAIQNDSDFLLITSSKVENGKDYSIAGKTFDYFSSRNRIIGFVTEGDQRDILDASGIALCLDPDDAKGSANRLFLLLSGELSLAPHQSYIDQHLTSKKLDKLNNLL
jgi:glycosyltransferase involved in cell wall biosynthesis